MSVSQSLSDPSVLKEGTMEENDTFAFEEWLTSSGLSVLKDIFLKHNMTNVESLSTESEQFAHFISDPMLLPRAMLIPLAIQSMQQLQTTHARKSIASSSEEADNEETKQTVIAKQDNNVQNDSNIKNEDNNNKIDANDNDKPNDKVVDNNNDDDNDNDNDNENVNNEEEEEGKYNNIETDEEESVNESGSKLTLLKRSNSNNSVSSVGSFASVDGNVSRIGKKKPKETKFEIIKENKKKKRKMVKLKESDFVRLADSKKEGVIRFIGETEFAEGTWYGIEMLIDGDGDCDGSVDDVVYFECAPNKGLFAVRANLRRIAPKEESNKESKANMTSKSEKKKKKKVKTVSKNKAKAKSKDKDKEKDKDDSDYEFYRQSYEISDRQSYKKMLRSKRKAKHSRPATLGAVDFGKMFDDRTITSRSNKKKDDDYYKRMRQKLKKDGPRQIGKIKYKGIDSKKGKKKRVKKKRRGTSDENMSDSEDYNNDGTDNDYEYNSSHSKAKGADIYGERTSHYVSKTSKKLKKVSSRDLIEPKLGPREIGKIKYKGLKLSKKEKEELEKAKFLDESKILYKKKKKQESEDSDREQRGLFGEKLGPQQIGKIKYKGLKLSKKEKEELEKTPIFADQVHHVVKKKEKTSHQRTKSLLGSKLGPQEIGKLAYKGTKMDQSDVDDNTDILSEKIHPVIKKKWRVNKNMVESYDSSMDEFSELSQFDENYQTADIDSDANSVIIRMDDSDSDEPKTVTKPTKKSRNSSRNNSRHSSPKFANTKTTKAKKKPNAKNKGKTKGKGKGKEKEKEKETEREKKQRLRKKGNHYASESDHEYIARNIQNIFEAKSDDESQSDNEIKSEQQMPTKVPSLVQSHSTSSKHDLVKEEKETEIEKEKGKEKEKEKEKNEEIAHVVHGDQTTDDSETDNEDNGSLNALSSSEEEEEQNNDTAKRWL